MFKVFYLFLLGALVLNANFKPYNIASSSTKELEKSGIEILDSLVLDFLNVKEISAIVYKKKILYALSDKGILHTFKLKIKNDKIKNIILKSSTKLKDKHNKKLKKRQRDSEGLAFYDKKLLISFEKNSRVELRSKKGKFIDSVNIHKNLENSSSYSGENKGLESLAYNEKYGLITAPENPLKGTPRKKHILYAQQRVWDFPVDGGVTSLEFMNEDEIMILQRNTSIFSLRIRVVISKLNLKNEDYTILADLDSFDGWNLDNFEGLAKFAHNRYLMVSDDNDSIMQRTILVLFRVKKSRKTQ